MCVTAKSGSDQPEVDMAYEYVDGNALAGPLLEVFALDMTAAIEQCASCGRAGPVATLRVYSRAPGRSALPPRAGRRLAGRSRRGEPADPAAVGDLAEFGSDCAPSSHEVRGPDVVVQACPPARSPGVDPQSVPK